MSVTPHLWFFFESYPPVPFPPLYFRTCPSPPCKALPFERRDCPSSLWCLIIYLRAPRVCGVLCFLCLVYFFFVFFCPPGYLLFPFRLPFPAFAAVPTPGATPPIRRRPCFLRISLLLRLNPSPTPNPPLEPQFQLLSPQLPHSRSPLFPAPPFF